MTDIDERYITDVAEHVALRHEFTSGDRVYDPRPADDPERVLRREAEIVGVALSGDGPCYLMRFTGTDAVEAVDMYAVDYSCQTVPE